MINANDNSGMMNRITEFVSRTYRWPERSSSDKPAATTPIAPTVDLTTVAGTYVTVAMVLAMAEEGVPAGKELPFKPGEP
jgi:hypothetical protein